MRKVQTQLLVTTAMRDRLNVLAVIRREPRAEVIRVALEGGGVAALERAHTEGIGAMNEAASARGITREVLAKEMLRDGLTLEDVRGAADVTA